jgi:hypothetical protein
MNELRSQKEQECKCNDSHNQFQLEADESAFHVNCQVSGLHFFSL